MGADGAGRRADSEPERERPGCAGGSNPRGWGNGRLRGVFGDIEREEVADTGVVSVSGSGTVGRGEKDVALL